MCIVYSVYIVYTVVMEFKLSIYKANDPKILFWDSDKPNNVNKGQFVPCFPGRTMDWPHNFIMAATFQSLLKSDKWKSYKMI